MLGHLIADQNVRRPAGRHRDSGRHQTVFRRREIGSAARRQPSLLHAADEIGQPVGIGDAIAVGIGDDRAGRRLCADVARDAESLVRLADDPAIGKPLGDFEGAVPRAVIDDDDLVIRVVERCERGEAGLHRALGVVGADHDRHPRITRQRRRQDTLIAPRHRLEGGLRPALAIDQAKRPILDLVPAGKPFVGPREDEGAGDPRGERGTHLPIEGSGLLGRAVAQRVDAEFGQYQRLVDRQVVQPGDIAAEGILVVQIDVEAQEIGEIGRQILGRRKVGVADQRPRVLAPHQRDELLQERPNRLGAVPADHVGRDLVADEIGEHRWMPPARPHPAGDRRTDLLLYLGAVEKRDVLRPRQADQHLEPGGLGEIEQPDRRHGEHAQRVDPGAAHQREVALDHRALRKLRAVAAGSERTVGHSLDKVLGLAREEKLALHVDRAGGRRAGEQLNEPRRRGIRLDLGAEYRISSCGERNDGHFRFHIKKSIRITSLRSQ
jgi:hypothetical protein